MARLCLHDTLLSGQLASLPSISGYWQHYLLLTKPLVVSFISPLFVKSKTISHLPMSALHKPSQRNSRKPETKQQQPTTVQLLYCTYCTASLAWDYHKEMTIDHVLILRIHSYVSVYVWLQPEINSLLHPCLCNNRGVITYTYITTIIPCV